MDKNMLYNEYKSLKDEISYYINLQITLTTFTITAVTGIYALGINNGNSYIYLLPFIIIIPIFFRILYYQDAIMRLAAYMIVFLEPQISEINWETLNAKTIIDVHKKIRAFIN